MKTEYMNDLPYPNETCTSIPLEVDRWVATCTSIPLEVDRWVATCIRCDLEFVNTLTEPIYYADADLYPNVHPYQSVPVYVRDLSGLVGASRLGVEQH